MPHPVIRDVKHPDFPHGTERGYFRGCSDRCCVTAHSRESKRRALGALRGQKALTNAAPVREHLAALLDQDSALSAKTISTATGLDYGTIYDLMQGRTERLRAVNAGPLMALTLADLRAVGYKVPAKKARQEVKSMMRLGWSGAWICERLGYAPKSHSRMPIFMYSKTDYITRALADKVHALAAEVGDRHGPSRLTALRSERRGWHVPGAYDDNGDLIPGAAREGNEEEVVRQGRALNIAIRRRTVAQWTEEGLLAADIAERLGVSVDVVEKDRIRGLSGKALDLLAADDALDESISA